MALKPESSLMVSLGVGAIVYAIFTNATPSIADIRSLDKGNNDVQRSERAATWASAATVSAISLLAKDPTIFVIGGAMTVGMAWWHRHADQVDPATALARTIAPTAMGNTPSGVTQAPEMSAPRLQLATSVI